MLWFDVDDVKEFSSIIGVTEEYVPELRIDADTDGLSFRALNQSHVVFVDCMIQKEYFSTYDCDEPTSFMVDTLELKKALSRIKGQGRLHCSLDEATFNLKHLTDNGTKTFKISLISEIYDKPNPPSIPYTIHTKAPFDKFKEYSEDARLYNDAVVFKFEDDRLGISTGNDYAEYESQILLEDTFEETKVVISGDYLHTFLKLGFNDELTVETGSDMPLNLSLVSLDETLTYKVLIAPRLDVGE